MHGVPTSTRIRSKQCSRAGEIAAFIPSAKSQTWFAAAVNEVTWQHGTAQEEAKASVALKLMVNVLILDEAGMMIAVNLALGMCPAN